MVTLTFDTFGLVLVGLTIFMGLAVPMARNEYDNWIGVAYAACIIVLAAMLYLMAVGVSTMIG